MTDREKTIDGFAYWIENEENGVCYIPLNLCEKIMKLLKEDECRLQEFNRNCYMSDDLPPIGGFHDDSCEEDDLYDTPIGGFHD